MRVGGTLTTAGGKPSAYVGGWSWPRLYLPLSLRGSYEEPRSESPIQWTAGPTPVAAVGQRRVRSCPEESVLGGLG